MEVEARIDAAKSEQRSQMQEGQAALRHEVSTKLAEANEFRTELAALGTKLRGEMSTLTEASKAAASELAIGPARESLREVNAVRASLEALAIHLRQEIERRVEVSEIVVRQEFAEKCLALAVPGDKWGIVSPVVRAEIAASVQACKEMLRREFSQYVGNVEVELRKSVILRSRLGDASAGSRMPANMSEMVIPVKYDETDDDSENPLSRSRMDRARAMRQDINQSSPVVCGMFPAIQGLLSNNNSEGDVSPGDVVRL